MSKAASLALFRRYTRIEEEMIRASMPRTSALDGERLTFAAPAAGEVLASRAGVRLVRPLTFTLAEVK